MTDKKPEKHSLVHNEARKRATKLARMRLKAAQGPPPKVDEKLCGLCKYEQDCCDGTEAACKKDGFKWFEMKEA